MIGQGTKKKGRSLVVGGGGGRDGGSEERERGVLMTANMAMVEEPLYPIAILIENLKNDDIQLRLNSILHSTGTW